MTTVTDQQVLTAINQIIVSKGRPGISVLPLDYCVEPIRRLLARGFTPVMSGTIPDKVKEASNYLANVEYEKVYPRGTSQMEDTPHDTWVEETLQRLLMNPGAMPTDAFMVTMRINSLLNHEKFEEAEAVVASLMAGGGGAPVKVDVSEALTALDSAVFDTEAVSRRLRGVRTLVGKLAGTP